MKTHTLTQSAPNGFSQGLFQRSFVKLSMSHLMIWVNIYVICWWTQKFGQQNQFHNGLCIMIRTIGFGCILFSPDVHCSLFNICFFFSVDFQSKKTFSAFCQQCTSALCNKNQLPPHLLFKMEFAHAATKNIHKIIIQTGWRKIKLTCECRRESENLDLRLNSK